MNFLIWTSRLRASTYSAIRPSFQEHNTTLQPYQIYQENWQSSGCDPSKLSADNRTSDSRINFYMTPKHQVLENRATFFSFTYSPFGTFSDLRQPHATSKADLKQLNTVQSEGDCSKRVSCECTFALLRRVKCSPKACSGPAPSNCPPPSQVSLGPILLTVVLYTIMNLIWFIYKWGWAVSECRKADSPSQVSLLRLSDFSSDAV